MSDSGTTQKRPLDVRVPYLVLAVLFTALAVYGSLVPLTFDPTISVREAVAQFRGTFRPDTWRTSRIDLAVNFLLFVPISFFWLGVFNRRGGKVGWRSAVAWAAVMVACTGVSLAIEFAQVWIPERISSGLDVAAQLIGCTAGIALWWSAGRTVTEWLETYLGDMPRARQFDWLLQAYFIGFLIHALMPLDLTIHPGDLYGKYKAGRIVAVPLTHDYGSLLVAVYSLATDLLVSVPIGMLVATALLPARKPPRSVVRSTLLGFGVVVAIELCQLFVWSRFTDVTDLFTGTAGVALGAWLMRRWRSSDATAVPAGNGIEPPPRPILFQWRWMGVTATYAILLVTLFWAPFDFTSDNELIKQRIDQFFAPPLVAAERGDRFLALTAILRKFLLFVPLGALMARVARPLPREVRRFGLAVLVGLSFALALGIELGQVLSPRHVGQFFDSIICVVGAVLGAVVTSRLLHSRSHTESKIDDRRTTP